MKSFYATALALCISSTYAFKLNATTQKQFEDHFMPARLAETEGIGQEDAYNFSQRKTLIKKQTDAQLDYNDLWDAVPIDKLSAAQTDLQRPGGLAQT